MVVGRKQDFTANLNEQEVGFHCYSKSRKQFFTANGGGYGREKTKSDA